MNSLPMLLQPLHIALDHIIHIYMIHEMSSVSNLVFSPEYKFANDVAHINQRFSYDLRNISLQWQILHNTYQICRDIVSFTKHKNIVIWYIFRCFEALNRQKSTIAYQLVKTLSICK